MVAPYITPSLQCSLSPHIVGKRAEK
jgi:hypothetical protein